MFFYYIKYVNVLLLCMMFHMDFIICFEYLYFRSL